MTTDEPHPLAGKAVAITGAAAGLGAAYARALAELGASVTLADIDGAGVERVAAEIRSKGGRASSLPGDVGDWAFGARLVAACGESWGKIDALVNNAGVLLPARIEDATEAEVAAMIRVNLMGTFACGQAAIVAMRTQPGGGAVINVTSGSQAGDVALSAYGATKGAIATLTFAWAMECRGSAVRVNAISPLAATAMAASNAAFMAAQMAGREIVYGVLPDPAISAPLVCWLVSDAARDINGQVVRLAGRDLSLVTHPQIARPLVDGEWSFDTIGRAFDQSLRAAARPLGLSLQREERA